MRNFQDITICIMATLFPCLAAAASGDAEISQAAAVMAIPEVHFLSTGNDPNYVPPAKQIPISHEAFAELVKAFKQSGNQKYARRLAVLLYSFSRRFESKAVGKYKPDVAFEAVNAVEMVLVQAFLVIRDSKAAAKLSSQLRADVVKAVENDLIRPMVDAVIKEHKAKMGAVDPADGLEEIYPGYLADIALVGRAISEPDYVRVAYRYLSESGHYARSAGGAGLTFDMHSTEGQQGHLELMWRVRQIFNAIEGYSDPAGFKDKDGRRYDNVSMEDFPHVQQILGVLGRYALPDGRMNLLGSTKPQKICDPLKESGNVLLSGFGHAVLGSGTGADQSQVQLHFAGQGGKVDHGDCLSLVWYAHGQLMSGEIGAQLNKLPRWAESTLSHNTVVVDGQDQIGGDALGSVEMYVSDIKGLSVIQVDGAKSYRHLGVKTYRRTIILNTIDPKRPYFVDVFEVEGGTTQDYSVHGSVFGDMAGNCSLDMRRMEGERPLLDDGQKWSEPDTENTGFSFPSRKYGVIRNVDTARANEDFSVTFACKNGKRGGTRVHMTADKSMDVFLGESPSVRSDGENVNVHDLKTPHFIARRVGEKGLRSRFVAVYDMFEDQAKIRSVKRLNSLDAYVGLEIDLGGRVDKLLYCSSGKRAMIGGGVQMKGRLGLVTEEYGSLKGYLIGGTILRKSSMMVRRKKASYSGRILTETRNAAGGGSNAFTVDVILPTGRELSGKWMIVKHGTGDLPGPGSDKQMTQGHVTGAYQIDRIERDGARMVVYVTGDHGLEIEDGMTREAFSGWRNFAEASTFVIYTNAESLLR